MKKLSIVTFLLALSFAVSARTALAEIILGTPQWDPDNIHFDIAIRLVDVPADPDLFGVQGHISIDPSTTGFAFESGVPTSFGGTQPLPAFFISTNPGEPLASYFAPAAFQTGELFILHMQRTDPTKTKLKLITRVEFTNSNDETIPFDVLPPKNVVDFAGTVPEPTTWAMLIGGLGLLVVVRARRS